MISIWKHVPFPAYMEFAVNFKSLSLSALSEDSSSSSVAQNDGWMVPASCRQGRQIMRWANPLSEPKTTDHAFLGV
jgi:hypothetical protein